MADPETEPKLTLIPGPQAIRGVFGIGNQLFVHGSKGRSQDGPSGDDIAPKDSFIQEVRWDNEMHQATARKLVNETHLIFTSLQKHEPENAQTSRKPQMVKFSHRYRSVLKACIHDMRTIAAPIEDLESEQLLSNSIQLFELMELIWGLCQILFVEILPGGVLLTHMLEWIRWHFTGEERHVPEILSEERPETNQNYWDAVHYFVLQGKIEEARKLLSLHSEKDSEAFKTIDILMRKMPQFASFTGQSLAEFDMRWRHWQDEVLQRYEDGHFTLDKNLETICRILWGDDQVFIDLADICETWYFMLVAKLLYQCPTVKAFDLHYHAQSCIDGFGGNSHLSPLDSILLAALEFDVHQVIKESSDNFSNWWFVAHLTDLLHHCGQLESQKLNYGSNLREYLLLDYASSLMSHFSLWQTGISYLDHCPQFGRHYQEQYLERIPLTSERKAQKLLQFCEQRELFEQARCICKVMGIKALQNCRMGAALSWCLRSKDAALATFISEKFLTEYSDGEGFRNLDLIDNLGPAMLLSNRLTFLGKYREFHQLYEDKDFKAAASLLLSLLTAKLAPQKFWFTLLMDTLPLLEADEVIFDSQQTYELMHCLEELTLSQKLQKHERQKPLDAKAKGQMEAEKDKLDLMRLALARNLARAIVAEGSTSL